MAIGAKIGLEKAQKEARMGEPEKVGLTRAGLTVNQTMADPTRTGRQKAIQPKALPRRARQRARQAKAMRLMVG